MESCCTTNATVPTVTDSEKLLSVRERVLLLEQQMQQNQEALKTVLKGKSVKLNSGLIKAIASLYVKSNLSEIPYPTKKTEKTSDGGIPKESEKSVKDQLDDSKQAGDKCDDSETKVAQKKTFILTASRIPMPKKRGKDCNARGDMPTEQPNGQPKEQLKEPPKRQPNDHPKKKPKEKPREKANPKPKPKPRVKALEIGQRFMEQTKEKRNEKLIEKRKRELILN
ncbi:serine-rich 25 kDa antigen protein-like [Drosophila ficusphila]|uniref:serine-rich 25 kDa antigen protein-like n=1 Tax=Drosophila ficusphila TaxID=30025 RepID=UPI0007E80E61|nr:serine-rich 25 kDa antigen protein-like [Drosophila ficusphila]